MPINTSPNMGLPIPVTGQEPGPQYANDVNSSLILIDSHSHVLGQGVPITPAAMNINANLSFAGNSATNLAALTLLPQASPPVNDSVYVSGVDLYFADGNGNHVRMTSGGNVNATSSGISSGTASASFVAGVLVVDANTNTPANVQCASVLLGNNVANSKYLTLSPPNAMGSNYSLVLPSIPAQLSILTIDTSGNIGTTMTSTSADPVGQAMSSVGANATAAAMNSPSIPGLSTKIAGQYAVVAGSTPSGVLGVVRVTINAAGSVIAGEGLTVNSISSGSYLCSWNTAFADTPVVTVCTNNLGIVAQVAGVSASNVNFTVQQLNGSGTTASLNIIAVGLLV